MITQLPTPPQTGFSVDSFAQFWAHPDPSLVRHAIHADVVGYWPGTAEPVVGLVAYADRIAKVIARIPDLRLEENIIVFDTALFEQRVGDRLPHIGGDRSAHG